MDIPPQLQARILWYYNVQEVPSTGGETETDKELQAYFVGHHQCIELVLLFLKPSIDHLYELIKSDAFTGGKGPGWPADLASARRARNTTEAIVYNNAIGLVDLPLMRVRSYPWYIWSTNRNRVGLHRRILWLGFLLFIFLGIVATHTFSN